MSTENMAPDAVQVQNLSRSFGAVQALRGLDFSVPQGQILGVLGPNGAGKTTAIRILAGLLAPDSGTVQVAGCDVVRNPAGVRSQLGYLAENNPLWPEMRVCDLLRFVARARGLAYGALRRELERVGAITGLESIWRRTVGDCSKGFRQRVGLAQAILGNPPLLLLDEPTSGLDPLQMGEMRQVIRDLGQSSTVLLTSHVLPEVRAVADRLLVVAAGRVVADCPANGLTAAAGMPGATSDADHEEAFRRLVLGATAEVSA